MPPRQSAAISTAGRREHTGASEVTVIPKEVPFPKTSARLRPSVVEIFGDAQRSTTGHRKLVVRLRKIQEICSGLKSTSNAKQGGNKDDKNPNESFGEDSALSGVQAEREFNAELSRCLLRVLPVKRTEAAGDRVVKFLAAFLIHSTEKDSEILGASNADDADDADADATPETPTSRLTFALASTFIPLTAAKDRTVRYRATQIITHIVGSLGSIDDELYYAIRQSLTRRIRDKEPAVRNQAVTGLSRLVGDDGDGDGKALLDKLLDILQNDSNAEVRRTLLLNLPLTRRTLPFLLERARDIDTTTRKALYSRLLPTLGDFRHLSLSMREKLLRWGIQDRDEAVRKATGRLFYEYWIEDCAASHHQENGSEEPIVSNPALIELMERIDVLNSGLENGVAHEAMRSFWEGRPDYRQAVNFDDEFWDTLTPESIFMARSFNDFCRGDSTGKYGDLIEEKLPEVTALAIYLHKYTTELVSRTKSGPQDESLVELEFIVEQLLNICLTLDYSDEIGRRKMFTLLREILATPELSEGLVRLGVEVLRTVCGSGAKNEAEFCSVVLEAIAEVHDTITTDDNHATSKGHSSADSDNDGDVDMMDVDEGQQREDDEKPLNREEAKARLIREIMVNMKCLYIAQCMLQNIEGNLQNNDNLVTMLNNLIVPAVRSHEAPIRERGLECLGLCCLLDRNLAEENLGLFVHCFNKGHEALQEMAIKILADILTVHTSILVPAIPTEESKEPELRPYHRPVLKVFAKALRPGCPQSVQAAATISLSKLLLTGTLSPNGRTVTQNIREMNGKAVDQLLQALILAYFNPGTKDNLILRQALTYFLPVYCHSRSANAKHMCRIAVSMVGIILAAAEEYFSLEAEEDSDGELIDGESGEKEVRALMSSVVGMLIEWTDERRVVDGEKVDSLLGTPDERAHAWLHLRIAKDLLERVLGAGEWSSAASKGERKYLLSMLGKLHIPSPTELGRENGNQEDTEGKQLAMETKELLDHAISMGIATDATSRNALVKAKNSVLKILAVPEAAESKSAWRRRGKPDRDDDDETVIGDATITTETATLGQDTTVIGETEGEREEGESTVLAKGIEQMRM
ncbi:hypothetical protein KEM54_005321 [Ascosphaera aggregata]|nr:hypothetical protein KEM54_005321 [Ascosphaera aggregata]